MFIAANFTDGAVTNSTALDILTFPMTGQQWHTALKSVDGAAAGGLVLGGTCPATGSNTCSSQAISLNGVSAGSEGPAAGISAESNGNLDALVADGSTIRSCGTPKIFSKFPACGSTNEGACAVITDSTTVTWGATITGGSTNHVLGYCDGSNWTVSAK
jgi:hypothetical protein